ncbi:PAS domain S-box protein [Terriglobus sp. ADX1]|uniref:PAS domain S-box protein n=1 Tax=Terriglobus sp. ADX1 TaxID=2794063 RepID=UPI002FE55F93
MSIEEPTRVDGRIGTLPAHERTGRSDRGTEKVPVEQKVDVVDASWLLECSPSAYVLLSIDGAILFANPALLTLTGRIDTPLLGVRFQDLLSTGSRMFYETQFKPMLLMRGAVREISLDLIHSDGRRVPVFVNAVAAPATTDGPKRLILTLFEATQRKQYESELLRARRESERVAEVVQRSSDAIFSLTADGKIQSWNDGAELIFGLTLSEAIERSFASLFPDAYSGELATALTKLSRGNEARIEMHSTLKDGDPVDVSVILTPHMEAPGILVAFSAVIRDSTLRKRGEKALLQSEKLASVGRLASSIAHEINNPLEAVTNLLYILETQFSEPKAKEYVAMAQEELARVSHIATHTLRFHKQSSGRTSLDLRMLTDSVFGLYRGRLENQNIVTVNDSLRVSPLFCFENELRQVFVILVSNSFDAMRAGGRLIIRNRDIILYPSGAKGVRITVADNGHGMDTSTLARLFEPFFSTKGIGGTGLGLWISRDLIEKNGGRIRIRSRNRVSQSGTVVSMTFPHRDGSA